MANPLNTLRFPLHGERLIEASAGTGKTYTIAGLYLRLLLGHGPLIEEGADAGQPSAHERPLSVTEILVVTFTEAATAELRGRIRGRIHEARLAFMRGHSSDTLLAQLLDEVADHELAARRLLAAERQMDEAAVFTIHGFCQRMLKQNAFESGALFETEFLTDDSQLRLQAVSDYWRAEFYPVDKALASAVRALWPSPAALLREMGSWLDNSELEIHPALGDETLAARHQAAMSRIEAVKNEWLAQGDEIRRQTDGQVSRYTGKKLRRVACQDSRLGTGREQWLRHSQGAGALRPDGAGGEPQEGGRGAYPAAVQPDRRAAGEPPRYSGSDPATGSQSSAQPDAGQQAPSPSALVR